MRAFAHSTSLLLASLGWSAFALSSQKAHQAGPMDVNRFQDDYAVATVVCNDTWVPGALALGASLVNTGTKADRVLLISDDISDKYQKLAAMVFSKVIKMKLIEPHPSVTRVGAHCLTLQLRTWQLPYKKVLYMDADMIAIKNQDWMFESFEEFSATADQGMSKAFNGGMFLLKPSETTYGKLESFLQTRPARENPKYWQTGMQYFLNEAFPRCDEPWAVEKGPRIGCWWQHMGPEHNVFARYILHKHAEALLNRSADNNISSVHYAGDWSEQRKPWMSGCQERSLSLGRSDTDTHRMLLNLWKREFQSLKKIINQEAGSWFMNLWLPGGSADRLPKINCPVEKRSSVVAAQKTAAAPTVAPLNFWQKPAPAVPRKAAATIAAPLNLWRKRTPSGQQTATAAPVVSRPVWGSAVQKKVPAASTAVPLVQKAAVQATPAPAVQSPAKMQSQPPMAPWWQKTPTKAAEPEPEVDTSSSWAVLNLGQ